MVISAQLVTVTDFEAFLQRPENKDRLWELIEGSIIEKMPTEQHGIIAVNIGGELRNYLKQRKNGKGRVGVEIRHQSIADPRNSRLPDISLLLDPDRPVVTEGATPRYPQLIVEIKSRDNTYLELREKAAYYLKQGTQMVWLVYPEKRLIEVLTKTDFQMLNDRDILTGGDLLEGFSMSVADVFLTDLGETE
jgi:Uma2 family endonuclease